MLEPTRHSTGGNQHAIRLGVSDSERFSREITGRDTKRGEDLYLKSEWLTNIWRGREDLWSRHGVDVART